MIICNKNRCLWHRQSILNRSKEFQVPFLSRDRNYLNHLTPKQSTKIATSKRQDLSGPLMLILMWFAKGLRWILETVHAKNRDRLATVTKIVNTEKLPPHLKLLHPHSRPTIPGTLVPWTSHLLLRGIKDCRRWPKPQRQTHNLPEQNHHI